MRHLPAGLARRSLPSIPTWARASCSTHFSRSFSAVSATCREPRSAPFCRAHQVDRRRLHRGMVGGPAVCACGDCAHPPPDGALRAREGRVSETTLPRCGPQCAKSHLNRRYLPVVVLALVLCALPFVGASRFTVTLLTEAMIFAIWAMSLDLLVGYAGLVSFGHSAAFGLSSLRAGYFAIASDRRLSSVTRCRRGRDPPDRGRTRLHRFAGLRHCVCCDLALHCAGAVHDRGRSGGR